MKKLFTLVFAAFVAVSVFAQSRITLWEGEKTLDSGWPNVEVSLSGLATAKAGVSVSAFIPCIIQKSSNS